MTARVVAFPIYRNRPIVQLLASEMAALPDDEARDFLILHLEIEWDRLEYLAVDCNEIERLIDGYARAIWSRAFRETASLPGGVA